MTFKTQLTTDLADFLDTDEFAESITYNGSTITADLQVHETPETGGDSRRKLADLYVKASDVASPAVRDVVVADGVTWYVHGVPGHADGGLWRLMVMTDERPYLGRR